MAKSIAEKFPPQIKYIIGNEGCERYSYYGMRAILTTFMTQYLMLQEGHATEVMHAFMGACYLLPLLGAYVADRFMGRYYTILYFSLFYCLGHGVLALFENETGLYFGLALIALGAGSIKPCVSSFVGDQFKKGQEGMITKVYNLFYFIINFGSTFSSLLTPLTLVWFGPSVAFGIPGILMAIATIIFWMGRKHYVIMPATGADPHSFWPVLGTGLFGGLPKVVPSILAAVVSYLFYAFWMPEDFVNLSTVNKSIALFQFVCYVSISWAALMILVNLAMGRFLKAINDKHPKTRIEEFMAVLNVIKIFAAVSVFWALFDQHASTWVLQGQKMKQQLNLFGFDITILPSQMQAVNPILVMILIPIFVKFIYPAIDKVFPLTPLRKMTLGMILAGFAYSTVAFIQYPMDNGQEMNILWQAVPYLFMTIAEVMISITGLEFAYTQAPKTVKSTVMSFWLMSVFLGNMITIYAVHVNFFPLGSGNFFMCFAVLMLFTAGIFGVLAKFYKPRVYLN